MTGDILLGVVTGAHGLSGEVRVKTFTEAPERLCAYGTLHTPQGRTLEIAAARPVKPDTAVVRFNGIDDRAAAEQLANAELLVARTSLPAPAHDEFYHVDLIGLCAQDAEGRVIGEVRAVHNFGAGDVVELDRVDGGTLLLPFTRKFVPVVDLAGKHVIVAVPEDDKALDRRGAE